MGIELFNQSRLSNAAAVLNNRPYVAMSGPNAGHSVIAVNSGKRDDKGQPVYTEQRLQGNATLRKDEWLNLDEQLVAAARERLVVTDDLRAAGLTRNVGGVGTLISEWETGSEMGDAEATMDGESAAGKGRQAFGLDGVPIPIIQKPWDIGERMLLASRTRGASLDVTAGVEAARAVARLTESMIFNGLTMGPSGQNNYKVYGLTTSPNRTTKTIKDWTAEATTQDDILTDILEMVKAAELDRFYGPFKLYVPGDAAYRFRQDYSANYPQTLQERVEAINVIEAVRVADALPSGNAVLVQLTGGSIDLAVAQDVTTVQWDSGSGWTNHFQTYAAWAPRIKADFNGRAGIVHGATA